MKTFLNFFIISVAIGLVFFGCSSKQFINETPVSHVFYAEKDFVIKTQLSQVTNDGKVDYFNVTEGVVEEIQILNPQTEHLDGKIRVINPNERKYHVYLIKMMTYSGLDDAHVSYETLYEGDAGDVTIGLNEKMAPLPQTAMFILALREGEALKKGEEKSFPLTADSDTGLFNTVIRLAY